MIACSVIAPGVMSDLRLVVLTVQLPVARIGDHWVEPLIAAFWVGCPAHFDWRCGRARFSQSFIQMGVVCIRPNR